MTKDLILNVEKKWFDLIKSGKKKMEYREVKPFWTKRLQKKYDQIIIVSGYPKERNDLNSIIFPWNGYVLTSVNREEINYDETLKTLTITEPDFAYGIKLVRP